MPDPKRRPFCTRPKLAMKKEAINPSMSFRPEERVSATSGGGEPSAPQLQNKQDSLSDEMPGENPEQAQSEFSGPGDYSSRGEKQPILDYTPCRWMAQQLMESGEALPQGAIAETPEGEQLVSVSICHGCMHEGSCYGLTDSQNDDRLINKESALRAHGFSADMPEHLVAEKIARMKLADDVACRLLVSKGFSAQATAGIMRLASGMAR